MKNMFAPREKSRGRASEIKAWVNEHLDLGESDLVSVAELTCHEANCPPVETVVTVHSADQQRISCKIYKPMSNVDQTDVEAALSEVKS